MSEINISLHNEIENNEINKNLEDKSEEVDPLSFLSKDLLNSLDDIDFEDKQNKKNDFQLDETHKDSEENEEESEDDYILEIEKENNKEKDFFSFEIFKNECKSKEDIIKKEFSKDGDFSKDIPFSNNYNNNLNNNHINKPNNYFSIGKSNNDYPKINDKNDFLNIQINNFMNNPINFFNNSFTMNGKSGWICPHCKNFNYQSKSI